MNIYIINGPNLNLLGLREPAHYGKDTYEMLCQKIKNEANNLKLNSTILQSNYEGQIVEFIHEAIRKQVDGIIINPAAYSHTSIAIYDALLCYQGIIIEVHLSDVKKREPFRQTLISAMAADMVIIGHGTSGYLEAMEEIKMRLEHANRKK